MKVIFPNPYGYKLPKKDRIEFLKKSSGFSGEYAQFLAVQNGFSFDKVEEDSESRKYLEESEESSEGHVDLRVLYGLDSGDQYYDLEGNLEHFIFNGIFLPIGVDYGGNALVEVLAGKFKGYIASLDHEMHAGNSSIEEFIEDFELDGFDDMSVDEKANALTDEDLGLTWILASSINEFTELCVHCDDDFRGFIVERIEP